MYFSFSQFEDLVAVRISVTWNEGGRITLPPIAQASLSKLCSYRAGGESFSAALDVVGCTETIFKDVQEDDIQCLHLQRATAIIHLEYHMGSPHPTLPFLPGKRVP